MTPKQPYFDPVSLHIHFPEMEKQLLDFWYKSGVIDKYLHRNDASSKRFSFLDGPITANNPMGVHHAWGRSYKDLWQRYFTLRGYKERFQNGFDCQGLWVEVEVEKELGIKNKKDIENLVPGDKKASIAKFVELCKERVRRFSAIQTEQSKRLGYIVDWNKSYYTMSDENNYMIWHFLKTCHEKGWIYKGRDSVPWCPRCQTAISQHEMLTEDYKELTHETLFVKLPVVTKGWEKTYLLVWTTTPWTVPANVAVGVNTTYDYGIWKDRETGERYIFLQYGQERKPPQRVRQKDGAVLSLEQWIMDKSGKNIENIGTIPTRELLSLRYSAPFDHLERVQKAQKENPSTFHSVVDGSEIVVDTEGTGLLHVAPGAGKEDFDLGKKEKLPVISVIDDEANYLDGMGEFTAKNAKKHPEMIIDYLKNADGGTYLFKTMQYAHRYPACWRCKTELVWKVADEWYIAMDKKEASKGKTLREQMIDVAKTITWKPAFGLDRELDWLQNMHDWLISKKNRYWGLALPLFECKKCGWFTVVGSKEELHKKSVRGWKEFDGHSPHKPFIDDVQIACEACGETVSRLDDVGNVWLDAGIVGFSTLVDPKTGSLSYTSDKTYWSEWYPADFITESFPGQFKNWFYSMIAMSTVLENRSCFKTVLGYASMLGEDGRPMHKSWGNAIEFNEGADKIGADVMRWMFAKHDPEQNILFGYKLADETRRKFHLLLWNIYNFFITYATIDQWKPEVDHRKKPEVHNVLDVWILARLHELIGMMTHSLDSFDAASAANALENFVSDLSQWYVRRSRDRVGPAVEDGRDKSDCYQTLWYTLVCLSQLLAPINPFISDTIYRNLTKEESVHLSDWPMSEETSHHKDLFTNMNLVRLIAEKIHAKRKDVRIAVRQPLPSVTITGVHALGEDFAHILRDETNIRATVLNESTGEVSVELDTTLTPELVAEGKARELVRTIQALRKEKGCRIDERITVQLPTEYKNFPEALVKLIKKETLASTIVWGEQLTIPTG